MTVFMAHKKRNAKNNLNYTSRRPLLPTQLRSYRIINNFHRFTVVSVKPNLTSIDYNNFQFKNILHLNNEK